MPPTAQRQGPGRPEGQSPQVLPWQTFYKGCRNLVAASNGIQWYDYQRDVARRAIKAIVERESIEIPVIFPRQSGKTEVIADIAEPVMLLAPEIYPQWWGRGFNVGIFAPKLDRAQIIYNRLRDRFSPQLLSALGMSVVQSNGDTFTLSNGSTAKCLTANKNSSSEGHTFDLIVIDEAQDVDTMVMLKSIWPMGTATKASKIMLGTATTVKRYYYDVIQRERGSDHCFESDVDRVVSDRQKLYEYTQNSWHLNYAEDFEQQVKSRGKDDYIRMAYYLEWILERGMFITDTRLADLGLPYSPMRRFEYPCYAGLDLGKESDSTVLTVVSEHAPADLNVPTDDGAHQFVRKGEKLWDPFAQRNHLFVLAWLTFIGDRYTDQMPQVGEFLTGFPRLVNLTFDGTGVGKGVEDILWEVSRKTVLIALDKEGKIESQKNLDETLNAYSFGGKQQDLSDLWEDLMRMMPSKGLLHFPVHPEWDRTQGLNLPTGTVPKETAEFIKQMTDLQKQWKGPMLKCMVEEGGNKHDDYGASLALANRGVTKNASMRIDFVPTSYDPETGESEGVLGVDDLFDDAQSDSYSQGAFYL